MANKKNTINTDHPRIKNGSETVQEYRDDLAGNLGEARDLGPLGEKITEKRFNSWKKLGATLFLTGALLSANPQEAKSQNVQNSDSIKVENFDQQINSDSLKIDKPVINQSVDPTKIQMYSGTGIGTDKDLFLATRIQGGGSFFKGKKLQTNVFGFLDIDGNPLKSEGFGKLFLTKKIYKGFNIEAEYLFTGSGNNVMKFGLSFAGKTNNGGYKITVVPMSSLGKAFNIKVSGSTKIGDNGNLNAFVDVDGLNKSFYGETEFVYDFGKNIAGFIQARYGGLVKDPFLRGIGGIRLNIK